MAGMHEAGPGRPPRAAALERQVGAIAALAAVVAVAFGNLINNDPGEEGDLVGFLVLGAISVAVAAWVFLMLIPRARTAPGEDNRPARIGLVLSAVGLLTVLVFWTGLPFVLGAGGVLLGLMGQQAAMRGGRGRGRANAAIALGAVAFALAVIAVIGDEV